jgi:hypothetical protein
MSQKEFQRVKVIENAAGGRLSVREASRLLQLKVSARCSVSNAVIGPIPWAGSGTAIGDAPCLIRVSTILIWRKNFASRRTLPSAAKPFAALAGRENGVSAEAPTSSIPLPPAVPPTLWHDGAYRCQPS